MGALEFYPVLDSGFYDDEQVRIDRLYEQAQLIEQQLAGKSIPAGEPLTRRALTAIGTSAGGRQMKAIIAIAPDGTIYSGQTGDIGEHGLQSAYLSHTGAGHTACASPWVNQQVGSTCLT